MLGEMQGSIEASPPSPERDVLNLYIFSIVEHARMFKEPTLETLILSILVRTRS